MENVVSFLRQVLELFYFISGIALAVFGFYGLKQIKLMKESIATGLEQIRLMKKDITTRNDRQAIEKSIEFLDRFATKVLPLSQEYFDKLEENNLARYKNSIYDFKKIRLKSKQDVEALRKKNGA